MSCEVWEVWKGRNLRTPGRFVSSLAFLLSRSLTNENDRFGVNTGGELAVFEDAGDFPGLNDNKFRNDLNVVFLTTLE